MLPVRIGGTGVFLPETIVSSSALDAELGLADGTVERLTGVRFRHRADRARGETTSAMGARAVRAALDAAGLGAESLELIVGASAIVEQLIPDTAALIQRQLGLGQSGITCMSVHSTCLSFLTGLDVAALQIGAGRVRCAVVVSAEIASVGLDTSDASTYGLFGDGAAAAVLMRDDSGASAFHQHVFRTFGDGAYLTELRAGGTRHPPALGECAPEDGRFRMEGREVLRLALQHAPSVLAELVPPGSPPIDVVVPHQPSLLGLRSFERVFGADRLVVTLPRLGNCVAASLPLGLHEAIHTGRLRRGQRALLVGTGAGLSLGGLCFTY